MKSTIVRQAAAAAALATTLIAAPQSATAAVNQCTHSVDKDGWATITTVEYNSGSWKYVGSSLMHVHNSTLTKFVVLSRTTTISTIHPNCAS